MAEYYNQFEAEKAQEDFCERNQAPLFAPRNGFCPRCAANIYSPYYWRGGAVSGYSVEYAGKHLITGCPHCRYSFID